MNLQIIKSEDKWRRSIILFKLKVGFIDMCHLHTFRKAIILLFLLLEELYYTLVVFYRGLLGFILSFCFVFIFSAVILFFVATNCSKTLQTAANLYFY